MGHYISSDEFRVLIELISEISSELNFTRSAQKACQIVAKTLGADAASLFIQTDDNALEWVAGYALSFDEPRIELEKTLLDNGRSLEKMAEISKQGAAGLEFTKKYHFKSLMIGPLFLDRRHVGTIAVYTKQVTYFNAKQEEHLRIFSTPIALMIKNVLLHEQVKKLAETDELTQLYNRRKFLESFNQLKKEAEKHHQPISLAMIDLDHFKPINDEFGHEVGDQYLKKTAQLIRQATREGDIVARLGGDEFAVLLPQTNEAQAHEFAVRLRHIFDQNPFTLRGSPKVIGMSVGIETTNHDFDALLHQADEKMYAVKKKR